MINKTLLRTASVLFVIIGFIICPLKSVSFDNLINASKTMAAFVLLCLASVLWYLSKNAFDGKATKMNNSKKSNLANLALIVFGLFWIAVGIHTWSEPVFYFRGANVDFTGINKHVGFGLIAMGFIFIASYFWKRNSKQINSYKPGEYVAIVNKKNKSFGLVKSLELVLNDKQSFTFYCTTDKVAAMLLNDFVVGHEAKLKINTEDGKDCDLVGINAYAHGILIGQ